MPELPEVETTRQGVLPHSLHQQIQTVLVRNPKLRWPVDIRFTKALLGQQIQAIRRRGKYLIFDCEYLSFIIHLGMSGRLCVVPATKIAAKHDHIDIIFSNGKALRFTDPRRFGCFIVTENPDAHKLIKKLGVEPLTRNFHAHYLWQQCQRRQVGIKQLIMNSEIVVGVGNIYANEALFQSGLHPLAVCDTLSLSQCLRLVHYIKQILRQAIKQGGTTLKDFTQSDGKPGYFQQFLYVYGRKGELCYECQSPLQEIRVSQRSTIICKTCQPLGLEPSIKDNY